jgi:hypothetical protein
VKDAAVAKDSTIKVFKTGRSKSVGANRAVKILTDAKIGKRAGGGNVVEKRVYGPDRSLRTVFTVDAGSATFESDLGYAFKKSVERARRENKKKTGHPDAILPRR